MQVYGATETFMFVSRLSKARSPAVPKPHGGLGSAGRVPPGVEIIITDVDGKPLPTGKPAKSGCAAHVDQ